MAQIGKPGLTEEAKGRFGELYYDAFFKNEDKFISDVPPIVYHYTNLNAFMEIMRSKRLWASRSEFLNDMMELRYGQTLVNEQIKKLEKSGTKYLPFAVRLREALEVESSAPFIVCFCQDGDLLSQWRGYSSHGQGISVGFHANKIVPGNGSLHSVVYQEQAQAEFIFTELKLLADCYIATGFDLDDPEVLYDLMGHSGTIEKYCSLVKDPAFREENESRLIIPDYHSDNYEIKFRARNNNLIVPYVEIDVSQNWETAVAEVIIGPGPDRDIRERNIEHFLKLIGSNVPHRMSGCQFRQ